MKENQTYLKLILKLLSPPNTNGIPRTSSCSDSELLSVVTDQPVSVWPMTTNNTWLSTSLTSDWESWQFYPKETPRENLRNNLREKLRNQEELRRLKSLPPEESRPEVTLEKPKKITSRSLSHDSVYPDHTLLINFSNLSIYNQLIHKLE